MAGDVSTDGLGLDGDGRVALAQSDVVIHSAASVAFDSPLDRAVEVNLMGPVRLVETLADLGVAPHLVSVSTCYVAGNRRGSAPEEPVEANPFSAGLDWRAEVAAARRSRADTDARAGTPSAWPSSGPGPGPSSDPPAGRSWPSAPSRCAGTGCTTAWWNSGRARAASVGWPDAYAFTKALGEVALGQRRGDVPVSIVRPSIIESALAEPRPGWIRGFRMAEPIILSYARGLLREFPGVPEGVVDVIPVDLVVAAIIAAAAQPPPQGPPTIVQVATGAANPLRYQRLVDRTREWFTEHPLYDRNGQPIVVPDWSFPGRGRVEGQLRRATAVLGRTERVVASLPLRGRAAQWGAQLEERREQADRALTYVELYGAYTECEAVYGVGNLLALDAAMDDEDRRQFCLDPRVIDWDSYITGTHLPSVVEHGRARSQPTRRNADARRDRLRGQVLSADRQLVAFDLENTLIASNVVRVVLVAGHPAPGTGGPSPVRAAHAGRGARAAGPGPQGPVRLPAGLLPPLRGRPRRAELQADAREAFSDLLLTRSFPRRRAPGAGAPRPGPPHRPHHRRPGRGHRTAATAVRRRGVRPARHRGGRRRRGGAHRPAGGGAAHGRGPGPHPGRPVPRSTASTRPSRWPTRTRRRTCRCWRPSGSPWRSTPSPAWRPSPAQRGWLVEDFGTAPGFRHRLLPLAPTWRNTPAGRVVDPVDGTTP